jgi:hypothetical protein
VNGAEFPARVRVDHDIGDRERRLQAPRDARSVPAAFEYSRRLIGRRRPQRGIAHGNGDRQVHEAVQQTRIDDRAHPGGPAPPMLGGVDGRVGRDPDPEQDDALDPFTAPEGGEGNCRSGHCRKGTADVGHCRAMHAVLTLILNSTI